MALFFFRSDRIEQDLIMSVGLRDILAQKLLPGLITTTVVNFSPEGACLIVTKPAIDDKHLFFDTLNSESYNLILFPEGEDDSLNHENSIAARSIWMDTCVYQNKPSFKIGIRFLQQQHKFFKNLKRRSS